MTADVAVLPRRDGKEETNKEGNESNVVTALAQILGSADPETTFLDVVSDGVIPDEICLELAEHLGELVKAMNFDNRIETVFALRESKAISEKTEQYLLLAILEMGEREEVSACPVAPLEADDAGAPAETVFSIPEPTLESPTAAPPAPPTNLIADLIRLAAELQARFGTSLPEEGKLDGKLSEIRQAVEKLTEEEFASLRQILGSAILAQAELPAGQRQVNVASSLEVVSILLGQRQAELTSAAFTIYEVLVREGFQLTLRNGFDRPLMTISSIALLRNRFRRWLAGLGEGEEEFALTQKAVATLEKFLLAAADEQTKAVIRREEAKRLRERIVSSGIRVLSAVSEELVAAQPATKEGALQQVWGYLCAKRSELASELRAAGSATLGEAEAVIRRIFYLHSATAALRREMAELEAGDYNPLSQRPMLSDRDKRLAFYELERKELDSIRGELEAALKEGLVADRDHDRKKLLILSGITTDKLQELDRLIEEVRHG